MRVWTATLPAGAHADGELRGIVRHVRTGSETSFASWEELRGAMAESSAAISSTPAGVIHGEGDVP